MQSVLSKAVERFGARREAILAGHLSGAPGALTARSLSDSLDEAVQAIWEESAQSDAALVALGEYGRRESAPPGEVELMILRPGGRGDWDPVPAARELCNQLYGAGVEADYTVNTPEESLSMAKRSIESETAFLDARLVAGQASVFEDWMNRLLAQSRRSEPSFVERLRDLSADAHLRMDEATASLEPDLKEGKGALQDLAAIGWIHKVDPEVALPVDPAVLDEAGSFLHRVRTAVHLFTGRSTDLLQMDYQEPVAKALFSEVPDPSPEVALMRSLYEKCRPLAFALDTLLGIEVAEAGQANRFIQAFGSGPAEKWPGESLPAFIELLSPPAHSRSCLRVLEHTGALVRAIPEWEAVRCLPQRNIYHRFAVDVHLYETVDVLGTLSSSRDEVIRRAAEQVFPGDQTVVLLAALLHDIGKGDASVDHWITGERIAGKVTARMGVGEETAADISWLVRNHLLLSETATKRDIGDEGLIADLAAQIASERRLRMLYLLTVADSLATGPEAWSTWKATLVRRLFERVGHFLERGGAPAGEGREQARARAGELKSALPEYPGIDEHLAKMPAEWLNSQSLSALVKQSKLMMDFSGTDELSVNVSADTEAGVWEVIVVAGDRPGLFSKIAGSLALHDLSVVGARAFTREDGVALEVIRVTALSDEEHRFEKVADDARKALHGRIALDARVAEKRLGDKDRRARGKQEPTRIVVDNHASATFTVIEVHASDRIGRLYDITRAMAELELDIHIAKVSTYAEDIVDVFYVTDIEGRKVTNAEYQSEIEKAILARL